MPLWRRLKWLQCEALREKEIYERVSNSLPILGQFMRNYEMPLEIRNDAAHDKCISQADSERTRDFIIRFIKALIQTDSNPEPGSDKATSKLT